MAPSEPKALRLRRLTLTEFRNYPELRLEPRHPNIVICGANGSGKTNLIEAISLLAPGRGLRAAAFEDLLRRGNGSSWAVAGEIEGPEGRVPLATGWTRGEEGESEANGFGRTVRVARKPQKSPGALGSHMRLLWITPAMDRLFQGPASDRRRFLDRLTMAFDPQHGARVAAFEKLLRERNRILADHAAEGGWLASVEQQAGETAVAIAAARLASVSALRGYVGRPGAGLPRSDFPWLELEIEGEIEARLSRSPAVQVEDDYRRLLRDCRSIDQHSGRTAVGPHRSDLLVAHGPKAVQARLCSTGEQKALLIGIVLGHARAVRTQFDGWAPLLLLDEVAAHLDERRREALLEEVRLIGCETWLTGTDEGMFLPLRGRADFLSVSEGRVVRREM